VLMSSVMFIDRSAFRLFSDFEFNVDISFKESLLSIDPLIICLEIVLLMSLRVDMLVISNLKFLSGFFGRYF